MVLARLPNFLRKRDHWSPCSNTSTPVTTVSPVMAYSSPTMASSPSGVKAGYEYGLSSPSFNWGSIFGLNNDNDLNIFSGLSMEDAVDSPASSASGSASQIDPFADASVKFPAWYSEEVADHSSPEVEKVAPSSTLAPSRKLRRTGRLGKTPKTANKPCFEPRSPEADEGADFSVTRSFVIDPYLHPTPANRPLRQYVSAPELSEHQQQQLMAAVSASAQTPTPDGMVGSSSLDDLVLGLAWPDQAEDYHLAPVSAAAGRGPRQRPSSQPQQTSQHHPHYRAYQDSRPSSSSSAGQFSGGSGEVDTHEGQIQQQQPQTGGSSTLGEIDGSLYQRRRIQSRDGDMPSPTPIDTSTGVLGDTLTQRRPMHAHDARSAPLMVGSQRDQQRLDLQQLQLQSAALQSGNAERLSNLADDFLQHDDSSRLPQTSTGLGALDLSLGQAFNTQLAQAEQPAYGQHYLLYSDASLQAAPNTGGVHVPFGYTSNYPVSNAASGSSGLTAVRARRHTISRGRKLSTLGKNSPQQLGKQDLQPTSAGRSSWQSQDFTASSPVIASTGATQLPAFATPRSSQPGGNEGAARMPMVPVFVPTFADPWNSAGYSTPSTGSASLPGQQSRSLPTSGTSSSSFTDIPLPVTRPVPPLPETPQSAPVLSSNKQARKTGSSPNLRTPPKITSAPLPGTSPTEFHTTPRKIAGTRRVQSSKDLRDKAKRSPEGPQPSLPILPPGGFSFVNYGIEDAQELCSAVAPSGSYKIPLKGYGGPSGTATTSSGGGEAGPSSSTQQTNPTTPPRASSLGLGHKAPSAALKNKVRPRVKVDNSRWIQETGEDSDGGDSDSDVGGEEEEESRRSGKRRRSQGPSSSSSSSANATPLTPVAGKGKKKVGA